MLNLKTVFVTNKKIKTGLMRYAVRKEAKAKADEEAQAQEEKKEDEAQKQVAFLFPWDKFYPSGSMARKRHKDRNSAKKSSKYKPEESESHKDTLQGTSNEAKPSQKEHEEKAPVQPEANQAHVRISMIIYIIAAIVMGYLSISVSAAAGNMITILAGLVVLWVAGKVVQLALGRKEGKWLLGNGMIIYLFIWLIAWTFFYNFFVISG